MKRILLVLAGVLALGAAGVGVAVWRATSPTHGPRIEAGRSGKALLIIDLQEDYTGPHAKQPYAQADRLIAAANQLSAAARAGGWPVFFVKVTMPDDWYHGMMTGFTAIAGTRGAELDARLERPPGAVEIAKTTADAFGNPALDAQLAKARIGELYVAGVDAAFCVAATIGGARNRGFVVNAVREGIDTRHGTKLEALFERYRAMGAVMKSLDQATKELGAATSPP